MKLLPCSVWDECSLPHLRPVWVPLLLPWTVSVHPAGMNLKCLHLSASLEEGSLQRQESLLSAHQAIQKGPDQQCPGGHPSNERWDLGKKKNLRFLVPWCITSEAYCLVTFQRVPMRLSCHSSNPLINTCLIGFSSLPLFLSPLPAIATPRNSLF